MSANNGVIRIGRKGRKKFAIGEEDDPRGIPVFEVDVVVAFQAWIGIDNDFREHTEDRSILTADMADYHREAVKFTQQCAVDPTSKNPHEVPYITTAEALDFIARLREQYDELVDFFQPRPREKPDSPATSGEGLRFLVEES